MTYKKHKEFVMRVNSHSIWWNNRYARKDANRFIVLKYERQIYDTGTLADAINIAFGNGKPTKAQKKRWIAIAKEFDPESVGLIKQYWK